jgi:phosphotransacetylase
MAVVHPCDRVALESTVAAAEAGLIIPVLVGNDAELTSIARAASIDIRQFEIVAETDSQEATLRAVDLARSGSVRGIVKGSLHSQTLLHEITKPDSGLHTVRRMSHAYVMDVPAYAQPLVVTDAVVNISPSLDEKRDIVQNAVDLANLLGIARDIRVALLGAVEDVNPNIPSTLQAAVLSKMADRGQLRGATIDGPLALDDAISPNAAAEKGIDSPVAGYANVLVVPDFESGNILAKALILLAGAAAAGVVLGARVPIALAGRADSLATRVASIAIARLLLEK